jgi:8-oxo-dGTP pyrophosphatase MutT (NUDIX family)
MTYSTPDDFLTRARTRLSPPDAAEPPAARSDFDLNPGWSVRPAAFRPAAVLIGLLPRGDDYAVLLTLRPSTMTHHAGQVAFPGGRVDAGDPSVLATALREAEEEVGLDPATVSVLGRNATYLTGTGFRVTPFLALLPGDFTPRPHPREVADVFETPLSFLMNPANHRREERQYNGHVRAFYAMPHNGRYIWGATAGMIRSLYERLYGLDEET